MSEVLRNYKGNTTRVVETYLVFEKNSDDEIIEQSGSIQTIEEFIQKQEAKAKADAEAEAKAEQNSSDENEESTDAQ